MWNDRAIGRFATAWVLGFAVLLAAGCASGPKISDRDVRPLDHDQLTAALADPDTTVTLVDVRSPDAFDQGHLPGAINIPLAQLSGLSKRLYAADMVVVYATSENVLSTAAAKKLMTAGYGHIYDFRGGIDVWRERGGDVMTSTGGTRMS